MENFNNANEVTVEAYNHEATAYIKRTPQQHQANHKPLLEWINASLEGMPQTSKILEIGSATPRDANYIRSKGYQVQTSDGAQEFVDILRQHGEDAILFNVLTDTLTEKYDLFIATAVAPHFTKDDMHLFLNKLRQALNENGRIAFNVKLGEGDEWIHEKFSTKRYIHYWKTEDMRQLLLKEGFHIRFFDFNNHGDLPTHKWLNIIVEVAS